MCLCVAIVTRGEAIRVAIARPPCQPAGKRVHVCVCVCERERERERDLDTYICAYLELPVRRLHGGQVLGARVIRQHVRGLRVSASE